MASSTIDLSSKRILVVGAGLSGLSFCLAIHRSCAERGVAPPRITLIERDSCIPQADVDNDYSIGIRGDIGGFQALGDLGVLPDAKRIAIADDGFFMDLCSNARWHEYLKLNRAPFDADISKTRPESLGLRIPRIGLRKILLANLPSDIDFRWATTIKSLNLTTTTTTAASPLSPSSSSSSAGSSSSNDSNSSSSTVVSVVLETCSTSDQSTSSTQIDEFDLVVAADGSRSTVRELLFGTTTNTLRFTGYAGIAGCAEFSDASLVPKQIIRSHGILFGTAKSVFVAHESETRVLWALSFPVTTKRNIKHELASEQAREALLQEAQLKSADLCPEIQLLLANTKAHSVRSMNFYDKEPHSAALDRHVVFIGDSSHPVSPYGGSGANMGLVDGVKLASQLLDTRHRSLTDAIAAFDSEMLPRTLKLVQQQRQMLSISHVSSWFGTTMRTAFLSFISGAYYHPNITRTVIVGVSLAVIIGTLAGSYLLYNHSTSITTNE